MTKKIKRLKKIYYPAGLISLILLPVLCIWYLEKNQAFDKLVCIETNFLVYPPLNEYYEFIIDGGRKFKDINLTDSDEENEVKFDYAQIEIRRLMTEVDTLRGIHFHLDSSSKYKTLIQILDLLEIEQTHKFIVREDDIWVFEYIPKPIKKPIKEPYLMPCGGTGIHRTDIITKSNEEIEKERSNYIIQTAETFSISGVLFIIMIVLTFKRNYYYKS